MKKQFSLTMWTIFCLVVLSTSGIKAFAFFDLGTVIYVDSAQTDLPPVGTSWGTAYNNLQDALVNASACDTILIAKGTYYPDVGTGQSSGDQNSTFLIGDSVVVFGGFPRYGGTFGQRDPSVHQTILSGDLGVLGDSTDNAFHVVSLLNVHATTLLDGCTIRHGSAIVDEGFKNSGGGIYCESTINGDSCVPQIINCTIEYCYAYTRGGGLFVNAQQGGKAAPYLENCHFKNNEAVFLDGGAVFNHADAGVVSSVFSSCHFTNNKANNASGAIQNFVINGGENSLVFLSCFFSSNSSGSDAGAMSIYSADGTTDVHINNCQFTDNRATSNGGAIYINSAQMVSSNMVSIDSSTFTGNLAMGGDGGAIDVWADQGTSAAIVSDTDFRDNQSAVSGGAVMNYGAGIGGTNASQYHRCKFSNNSATYGGGANNFAYRGDVDVAYLQCLFFNDSASYGGAMDSYADMGSVRTLILNSTFSQNVTVSNAAIGVGGNTGSCDTEVLNSIIWNNHDTVGFRGFDIYGTGTLEIDYSVVDTLSCAGLGTGAICGGSMQYNVNPGFVDPANNDFHVIIGSSTIDAGQNDSIISQGLTKDLDGADRLQNSTVDLGPYEGGQLPFCISQICLMDLNIAQALYHAAVQVKSNGLVAEAGMTSFYAGDDIALHPGFEVSIGSVFECIIESCPED